MEHLRYLFQSCDAAARLGVAIDTCHLFAAGYDLRTPAAIEDTLGKLDAAVGLSRVLVVHANDAKGELGSGLDRHEHIGRGKLGREAFRLLIHHPALAALPFIIETPKHDASGREMDPANLRLLRRLAKT
jgi:deoxyribonuclease-4